MLRIRTNQMNWLRPNNLVIYHLKEESKNIFRENVPITYKPVLPCLLRKNV
jgi:hypothetical protein